MLRIRECTRGSWAVVVLISILLTVLGMSTGCGNQASDFSQASVAVDQSRIGTCLRNAGASLAEGKDDLAFFRQAQDEDAASLFGSAFEDSKMLFVDLWQDSDERREWLMWVAQPFEEEESPLEIATMDSDNSFVLYAVRPSVGERRSLKSCTE